MTIFKLASLASIKTILGHSWQLRTEERSVRAALFYFGSTVCRNSCLASKLSQLLQSLQHSCEYYMSCQRGYLRCYDLYNHIFCHVFVWLNLERIFDASHEFLQTMLAGIRFPTKSSSSESGVLNRGYSSRPALSRPGQLSNGITVSVVEELPGLPYPAMDPCLHLLHSIKIKTSVSCVLHSSRIQAIFAALHYQVSDYWLFTPVPMTYLRTCSQFLVTADTAFASH